MHSLLHCYVLTQPLVIEPQQCAGPPLFHPPLERPQLAVGVQPRMLHLQFVEDRPERTARSDFQPLRDLPQTVSKGSVRVRQVRGVRGFTGRRYAR